MREMESPASGGMSDMAEMPGVHETPGMDEMPSHGMSEMTGTMGMMGMMPSMALVPVDEATHTAVASGDWSDPAVWGGNVPNDGARVVIPDGVAVTVDGVLAPEIKTLRIDGLLDFATDRDTELKVDTVVSSMTGELRVGTAAAPIDPDVTAKITIADDGPIDRDWDPTLVSRGLLLHGNTEMHGAEKTGFLALAEQPFAGATTLTLVSVPTGWRVGDEIAVAGTDPADPASDEVVTITAIDGATVTIDRELNRDHVAPRADLEVHVANLSRNIEITSENEGALQRGHIMFMHTNDVDMSYVAVQGLGRTDKQAGVDDWVLETGHETSIGPDNIEVEELGGANVRGRYSIHFHRGGVDGDPGTVKGSVVRDDPGWAYVNHSSNVDFIGNVSHNIVGAAYNTEAGDEVGSFIGNIALRTVNPEANLNPADEEIDPRQAPDARLGSQDYGFQGDGFWFHGAGVTVEDNVVSGATGHAYIYWSLSLAEKNLGNRLVDVAQLPNGDMIGPDGTLVRTKHVPVPSFAGNDAYAASKGLQIHYMHTDNRDDLDEEFVEEGLLAPVPQAYEETLQSTFSDAEFWNIRLSGIDAPYSSRLTFEDIELIGTGAENSVGLKLDHFANDNNFTVRDVQIEGFQTGLGAPRQGQAVVEDVTIAGLTDIRIALPDIEPRDLVFTDITFAPLAGTTLVADEPRQNVLLDPGYDFDFGDGLRFGDGEIPDDDDRDDDDARDEDGAAATVAFLGDSITDWEDSFVPLVDETLGPEVEALNFGVGGTGLTDAAFPYLETEVAADLLERDADLVWIMIGGNDILSGATVDEYAAALVETVEVLQEMPSEPEIVIAAQPPFFEAPPEFIGGPDGAELYAEFLDAWVPAMEAVAEDTGAIFVDIGAQVDDYPDNYPDLIHPDDAGAATLAGLISSELSELLETRENDDDDDAEEDDDDTEDFDDDAEEDDEFDEFDEVDDEAFTFEDGYPVLFQPDRISFSETGQAPVGLYYAQQAPEFVPVPEGSEIARFIVPEVVGLTNAELTTAYGVSFNGALLPDTAAPADFLTGGFVGPVLPEFESFPPVLDPDSPLGQPGETGEDDEDDEPDDRVDLPEDAGLLAKLYLVFFGRLPDFDGFGFWLDRLALDATSTEQDVATAFAQAPEFAARWRGAEPDEVVSGLYLDVLGRDADAQGLAFWSDGIGSSGDGALADLGLAFARAPETEEIYSVDIGEFLDDAARALREPNEAGYTADF